MPATRQLDSLLDSKCFQLITIETTEFNRLLARSDQQDVYSTGEEEHGTMEDDELVDEIR